MIFVKRTLGPRAYVVYNIEILKRSEPSVINYTSKIKTMLLSKGIELNDLFWKSVYKFISSNYKNVGKTKLQNSNLRILGNGFKISNQQMQLEFRRKLLAVLLFRVLYVVKNLML